MIKINGEQEGYNLLKKLIKNDIQINRFEIMKPTLNDIFIEKVGGTDAWYTYCCKVFY